ncbi:MAG: hypothetical protein H8F28_21045 [Fibrella sp.]|nr:hypothetical protein [Armatimonadota bacterium]
MVNALNRILLCVGVVLLSLCSPVLAQDSAGTPLALTAAQETVVENAFKAGNQALGRKQYARAVIEYKKLLAVLPEETSTLWNCGMASFFDGDYATSVQCWKRLRTIFARKPGDDPSFTVAKVSAKLIQTYQAMGDKPGRDKERAALVKLRSGKTDAALTKQSSFCCDQFIVDGKSVFAYDYFALTGKLGIRYDFIVTKPDGTQDYHIALECNPTTNSIGRELGDINANERLFSIDGFYDSGRKHRTFAFLKASAPKLPTDPTAANPAPPYETVKEIIVMVIQGKIESTSGSASAKP